MGFQREIEEKGYSFHLVNIDCLPNSDHFNVIMDIRESIEELLPYLAAELAGCTYSHGSGVLNLMDEGHIVAIYTQKITITDLVSFEEAQEICRKYIEKISSIRMRRDTIKPVFNKKSSISVLDIFRSLPRTNCGLCHCPTCMAFAAKVFQRGDVIASCLPLMGEKEKYRQLLHQLHENGYKTP